MKGARRPSQSQGINLIDGDQLRGVADLLRDQSRVTEGRYVALGVARGDGQQTSIAFLDGARLEAPRRSPVASITKPITATAVLQLVEAGTIDLDAEVADYVPEFHPAPPPGLSRTPPLTVRHVLSHTSGLTDLADEQLTLLEPTPAAMLEAMCTARLSFIPGSAFSYASESFYLLSAIIERASGLDYPTYLRDRILHPLGMMATTFDPREPGPAHLPAQGHFAGPDRPCDEMLEVLIGLAMPGGGLWSTPDDVLRFGRAWLRDGELDGARILEPRSMRQMTDASRTVNDLQTGAPARYGLGWGLSPGYGASRSAIAHSGATGSMLVVDPENDLVIVYLRNWWGAAMDHTTEALEAVYRALS